MFKLTSEKRNPGSKLFALLPLMLMLIGFSSVLLLTSLARADSVLYGREMHQRDLRNFTTVKNLG